MTTTDALLERIARCRNCGHGGADDAAATLAPLLRAVEQHCGYCDSIGCQVCTEWRKLTEQP